MTPTNNTTEVLSITDEDGDVFAICRDDHHATERWMGGAITRVSLGHTANAYLTRSDLHAIHAWLTVQLGLCTPTPVSPLTASRADANATKEARNAAPPVSAVSPRTWPNPGAVARSLLERTDLSGGAARSSDVVG